MKKYKETIVVSAKTPELPKMPTYEHLEIEPVEKFVEPKFLKLSHAQIKAMSTTELLKILSGEAYEEYDAISSPLQSLINIELVTRATKTHWSVIPSFLLLVVSVILTTASVYIAFVQAPEAMYQGKFVVEKLLSSNLQSSEEQKQDTLKTVPIKQ